jgi:Domain of unknown function (DUF6429)
MQYDESRVVQAVLAVLQLTAEKQGPLTVAWKNVDFEIMNRLHELGFIEDPRGKQKSVVFTDVGAEAARAAAASLFAAPGTTS